MLFCCLLDCIVSDEKSAVILTLCGHRNWAESFSGQKDYTYVISFFLSAYKIFSLSLGFFQFDKNVPWCSVLFLFFANTLHFIDIDLVYFLRLF